MTALLMEDELITPYASVVSEMAIQHVTILLAGADALGSATSVSYGMAEAKLRRSLLELEGLGKEVWEGVDPKLYVEELRREWNAR